MEPMPVEAFLAGYPRGIQRQAEALRRVVKKAVPDAVERVRLGWRLVGYDLPVERGMRYFAFIWLEPEHVHIGYEHGVWMDDPDRIMRGAHLRLKKVRYLTYPPGARIDRRQLVALTREAARVARMTPRERMAQAMDRSWVPGDDG